MTYGGTIENGKCLTIYILSSASTKFPSEPERQLKIEPSLGYLKLSSFKSDKSKILLETVINYGEPFLVDALGNDLSIVILSKRGYKLPTGRVIKAKFVTTIIGDCRSLFGTPLNGYWKIPSQFLTKLSPNGL